MAPFSDSYRYGPRIADARFWLSAGFVIAWVLSDQFLWEVGSAVLRPVDIYLALMVFTYFCLALCSGVGIVIFRSKTNLVFFLLVALGAASFFWSTDRANTLVQTAEWVELFFALLVFPGLILGELHLRRLFDLLLLVCFLNEFIFFLLLDILFPSLQLGSYQRVRGEMWFSGIGLAISVAYLISVRKRKFLHFTLVLFFSFMIGLSLTRTVLIGSLSSVLCQFLARYRTYKMVIIRIVELGAVAGVMYLALLLGIPAVGESQARRIGDMFYLLEDNAEVPKSVEGRFAILIATARTFRKHPLLGVGLGGFGKELEEYRGIKLAFEGGEREVQLHKGSHNNFASMLGDLGLIGLSLYAFLTLSPVALIWRYRRNRCRWRYPEVVIATIGIWPVMVSYLLFMPFNTVTRFTLLFTLCICTYLLSARRVNINL